MIQFKIPEIKDYKKIVKIINTGDEIYKTIYSSQEFIEYGCGQETEKSLREGEKTRNYLGLYLEDDIIGFVSYRKKNSQTLWISMLYIARKYQKQGYGEKLMQQLEKIATKMNVLVIVLETDIKATWAIKFYKKCGFSILTDNDLQIFPFDKVLQKKQVFGRYVFGKQVGYK